MPPPPFVESSLVESNKINKIKKKNFFLFSKLFFEDMRHWTWGGEQGASVCGRKREKPYGRRQEPGRGEAEGVVEIEVIFFSGQTGLPFLHFFFTSK